MKEIEKIKPSGIFTNYVYKAIPLAFDESMSYYETLCAILKKLRIQDEVINNNADLIAELESYVAHYFDNLDVQEEINNKLDDMATSGELEEIIESYINLNALIGFEDISELKASTNLIAGSYAKVMGYNTLNDNGANTYYIRELSESDTVDDINLILLDSGLVAELIKENDYINLQQEGYYEFTGAQGNHATVWYAIISKDNLPTLTLANDTLDTVQHGYENARDNMSTVTINAGIFNTTTHETVGIIIKDGETIRNNINPEANTEILYMLEDGTLNSIASSTSTADVESLSPVWAVNGFYPIIKNGVDLTPARDPNDFVERSFIGQNSAGDYIVGCCNGRGYYHQGMSLADIVAFCGIMNFTPFFLFNLDGGGSSELDIRGERVNDLEYYNENRKVANFITFKSKFARNKGIFDKSVTTTEKWIREQGDLNIGINILSMLSSANENASLISGSSAVKRGRETILNLMIRITDTITNYTNLIQGLPSLSQGRSALFCDLISHTDGTHYQCYIYETDHAIRTAGSTALPNGLPAGDYTLNITYNNYF